MCDDDEDDGYWDDYDEEVPWESRDEDDDPDLEDAIEEGLAWGSPIDPDDWRPPGTGW